MLICKHSRSLFNEAYKEFGRNFLWVQLTGHYREYRQGVYKQIRYEILPIVWKNHRAMERKKNQKLTFLANELDNAGRTVEAHIVRTIVKPYIRDLNLKWSKMTALGKCYYAGKPQGF